MSKEDFDKGLETVEKFFHEGMPELARDKLEFLVRRHRVAQEDIWYIEELRARIAMDLGDPAEAQARCWASVNSPAGQILPRQQYNYSNYLFLQNYSIQDSDEKRRQDAFRYHDFEQALEPFRHEAARHRKHKKIRIGYLAPEFADGVVSQFAVQLLGSYDRTRFEVYCYSVCEKRDDFTKVVQGWVDGWHQRKTGRGFAPREFAEKVYEDEIDILFDLSGHTAGGLTVQVAAYQPAPVQLTGIGYMGTTGLRRSAYFLGDPYCDPVGESEGDFSETLLRMPRSHFCYTPSEHAYHLEPRYKAKAAGEGIVFGSFNNMLKVNTEVLRAWSEILKRVPGSRLLLKSSGWRSPYAQKAFRQRAQAAGISPERISLEPSDPFYMERYNAVDIALDTFPYVGGGTTCDALYMGVPVVSLYGARHGTRFGFSLLSNTGVAELAVASVDEYIERAAALAQDRELLDGLHNHLPDMLRSSPVMDAAGYMRDIQALYERVWSKWLEEGA